MAVTEKRKSWWRRWRWQNWVLSVLGLAFVVWFLAWGPMKLIHYTENPSFCASCHNMQLEYDTWNTSIHSSQICSDCHIPPQFIKGTVWDAYFGMRDFYEFYVKGEWPDPILALPPSKEFLKENCIRCHGYTAHASVSEDRDCWDCHRELYHRNQLWQAEQAQRRIDDPRN